MSHFKKAVDRKRQAAASQGPSPKDPSQMTEAELDLEVERLERDIRGFKERMVREAREAGSGITTSRRPMFLPNRNRRRYWK